MIDIHQPQTRRRAIVSALATAGAFTAGAHIAGTARAGEVSNSNGDWDWLVGNWKVRHRKLKSRLTGGAEWDEFSGTCVNWTTLNGQGNVDDNMFDTPAGVYYGVGVRAFDPATKQWAIWWLDSRFPDRVDIPVRGSFKDGVGVFLSDDTLNGRPIKVRFQWSKITSASGYWDQAFSPDGGKTWETNWTMEFTRDGAIK